uniref:Ubinuclein middle domain-containing protein n=1 Tax=Anopheles christyi TaxID=43041 RepID=A0A182K8K4_9DIPT
MSDVKRVTLTTISDVVKKGGAGGVGGGASPFNALSAFESSAATLNPFASSNSSLGGKGEGSSETNGGSSGTAKKLQTVRLELNLFEPTADSFPEFNFSKLIHVEQKRLKKVQKKHQDDAANGFLSDPELDNDVARMARELERKYGSGSDYATKGKAARPSKLDYYDRGAGYDEEDSFIDNSEAYDELIPQEIETVGGGFYINSGQLEFKQLSNFERPEDAHRMPKPKKRALSTTSESSDEDEPPSGEKKKAQESSVHALQKQSVEKSTVNVEGQQSKTQPDGQEKATTVGGSGKTTSVAEDEKSRMNGHVAKKQKIVDNGQVCAEPKTKTLSSEGGGKEKANGVKEKALGTATPGAPSTAVSEEGGKKNESDSVKAVKTTTVKDMLRAKRDSLRKMEQEKKGRSSGSSRVSSSEAEEDGDGGGDDEDEDEENDEEDDEDEEEDDEYDEEEGGSEKNSQESGSEVDIVSESESSHESEKDTARGKTVELLPANNTTAATNGTVDGVGNPVLATTGEQPPAKERKQKDSKLPDDISAQLRKDVESLKELARGLAGSGKINFFESKVADLLLRIDDGARSAGSSSTKNAVFRHLEAQLSVSRQSLQLKLKKIRIRKLESKTKSLLSKLEDVIADTMPAIVAKHELDCMKANDMRLAAAASQAITTNPLPNGEKGDVPPNPVTQIRNPKKKYTWNERSRDLLWELYSVRLQWFGLVRPRNQTEEEVLADFIRTKVVPLWPKSWIRYEDIQKELDRRKKVLAKSLTVAGGGSAGAPNSLGKKSSTVASPLVSPVTTPFDSAALLTASSPNGLKAHDASCPPGVARSTTPSSVKSTGSKGGMDVEKIAATAGNPTHHSMSSQPSPAANMSPNSSLKRTSDHSIINIMNSPPPPSADKQPSGSDQRRSFDGMDPSTTPFANPDTHSGMGRDSFKRSPATPASNVPLADRKNQLPDRQRWNSREDDSDSSIEIIAEYNVSKGATGGAASGVPFQSSKASASILQMATTTTPTLPGSSNLPVLNKEKYKNLIAAKHKPSHGGSGSSAGSSPIAMGDLMSPMMSSGKYSKQSPTTSNVASGGVIGFAAPSGNVNSGGMQHTEMTSGSGAGSVRVKDTPSPIDVDVHQIMKDLKELQELQKQHNTSGSRKSDSTSLQSQQQQHEAATTATVASTVRASSTVADYFIDCDMDEDDILFATNFTYSGGHKN